MENPWEASAHIPKVQDCQGQGIQGLSPLFAGSVYHEAQDGANDLVPGGGHAMEMDQSFAGGRVAASLDIEI